MHIRAVHTHAVLVMLVMSREKLLFWDPCCTSRVLLRAYLMSVLRGLPPVCLGLEGEGVILCC